MGSKAQTLLFSLFFSASVSFGQTSTEGMIKIESDFGEEYFKVFDYKDIGSEVFLPKAIFDAIEKDAQPTVAAAEKDNSESTAVKTISRESVSFAPVSVRLIEKTPGVLKDPKILIKLPLGGGEIKLNEFTTGVKGTFFVEFDFEEDPDLDNLRVFYVSKAKKRKLDGELWGAGCKKVFDIKKHYRSNIQKRLLAVNTTDFRHLTALGGHFVFSSKIKRQVKMAQVTFKDPTRPEYFCEFHADKKKQKENF